MADPLPGRVLRLTTRQALWAVLVAVFGYGLWAVAGWLQGLTVAALVAILGYMVERGRTQ